MSSDAAEILEARARRLAEPPPPPLATDLFRVVVFGRSGSRYAIDARFVREVRPVGVVARVPNAPSVLVGVTAVRSRVVALLETAVLVGQDRPDGPPSVVVVLGDHREPVGLTADRLDRTEAWSRAAVIAAPGDRECVGGTSPDGVTLLSGGTILDAPPVFAVTPP